MTSCLPQQHLYSEEGTKGIVGHQSGGVFVVLQKLGSLGQNALKRELTSH